VPVFVREMDLVFGNWIRDGEKRGDAQEE